MKLLLPAYSLFLLLFVINPNLLASDKNGQLLDKIIAVVNDEIILKSNLDKRIIEANAELKGRGIVIKDRQGLALKVLDNIIIEKLQLQRIKKRGIEVADDEILKKIAEIAKNNKLTTLQVRNKLNKTQPNGFILFREKLRQQLLFQKLRQVEVFARTQVTEDEINNYLQRQNLISSSLEYNIAHIVVNLPESATPNQRDKSKQKAQNLLNKLENGKDFSQLAVNSSDGVKALQGGDLGWLKPDQIPTFFSDQLAGMQTGEHSKLIKSPIGFHIIKLVNKRDRSSKIVKQYHLHRFTVLSDDVSQNKNARAPKRLIKLAKNIRSLADFKKLQIQYPDIPKSINENGDLGWLTAKDIPSKYYKAIKKIKANRASKPIASKLGWDIVYLAKTRKKDLNITNKRQQAMNSIRMKKANETFKIWLRRLKDEALIDNRLLAKK